MTDTGPIDAHIGKRVREYREIARFTEEAVARKIGVSVEEFKNLEGGTQRIDASHLFLLSIALGRSVDDFYEGVLSKP